MTSSLSSTRQLAAALSTHAATAAATTGPLSRTSTMQRAVVETVSTDKATVTTTDGIPALRLASYQNPTVGDVIQIATTATGAWIATGRLAAADDGAWRGITLTSPWQTYLATFQKERIRNDSGVVTVQGVVATTTSVTGTSNIATLPWAPPNGLVWATVTSGGAVRQIGVTVDGILRAQSLPAGVVTYLSINCQFTTF